MQNNVKDKITHNNSFLDGMARVLDIGATFDKTKFVKFYHRSDQIVIKEDWEAIGRDLKAAIKVFENIHGR